MAKDNRSRSFEIALSAISAAVAVGFLSLGILSGYLTGVGYLIGILALMVPLSKQFIRGDFLAYVATCILTVIMGAAAQFWDLVPFIMFFGLHPLANCLQIKYNVNKWLAYAIKAVWFDCTLLVGYFLVFGGVLGGAFLPEQIYKIINDYIYLIIFVGGTLIFFIYDNLIFRLQIMINSLVRRIRK